MRRIWTLSLACALCLAIIISAAPQQTAHAQGAGLVSSIIKKMDANRRTLSGLRAEVKMEKFNAQFKDSEYSTGAMIYMSDKGKGANVRIDFTKPQQEILSVVEGKYVLYRPRLNMAYVGRADNKNDKAAGALGFSLGMSGQQMRSRFQEPELLGDGDLDGGVHVYHMRLVPKGGARFKYAEIWVDDSGMPVQTKWVEASGDSTTIRLYNVQRNAKLSTDSFRFTLPDGVKRVES